MSSEPQGDDEVLFDAQIMLHTPDGELLGEASGSVRHEHLVADLLLLGFRAAATPPEDAEAGT